MKSSLGNSCSSLRGCDKFLDSAAQEKLSNSAVLIIGAGGLGCPAAIYLASSGVGRLGIVDQDLIEISNLHRQILYRETSLGTCKADSAAAACLALNSSIEVNFYRKPSCSMVKPIIFVQLDCQTR